MSVLIVDVEKEVESKFRQIVEKRFGKGEQAVEIVVNALMKNWVEKQRQAEAALYFSAFMLCVMMLLSTFSLTSWA